MEQHLKELVGQDVMVYSNLPGSSARDKGTLEGCDALWLRLRKDSGEMLYFCLYNVRLVAPVKPRV
jgi:hypothetical protein